jgi:hypothetical protein
VPKDWEVSLEVVGDGFFFYSFSKIRIEKHYWVLLKML